MPTAPIPLASKSAEGVSRDGTTESLVNLYPEPTPGLGRGPFALHGFPGMSSYSALSGTPRGQYAGLRGHFAVTAEALYSVAPGGAETDLGLIEGSQVCDIFETTNSLAIVADTRTYLRSFLTGDLVEITDPDFQQAGSGCFLGQRLILTQRNSGQFFWSEPNADDNYDTLAFATAEADTDNLIAARVLNDQLVLFGDVSTEFYSQTGLTGANAFSKSSSAAAREMGCWSRDTIRNAAGTLVFLAREKRLGGVMVATLQSRISTHAIETRLEKATNLALARGVSFMLNGHQFYELTIPGEFSAVYDFATGEWFQTVRGLYSQQHRPVGDAGRVSLAVISHNRRIVQMGNGALYELGPEVYANAGVELVREVSTPPWRDNNRNKTIGRVELQVRSGVGQVTGNDQFPVVTMCVSKDNGNTWSEPRSAQLGGMGDYGRRVFWTRLGMSRNWRFKFRATGDVPVSFYEAEADFTEH